MIDYTNRQREEMNIQSQTRWATKGAITNRSAIAEQTFREQFGARHKTHHVQIRFKERKTADWGIAPKRFEYVVNFPGNITVFATVDNAGNVEFNGWSYHRDILKALVPGKDEGTYIFAGELQSMSTLKGAVAS